MGVPAEFAFTDPRRGGANRPLDVDVGLRSPLEDVVVIDIDLARGIGAGAPIIDIDIVMSPSSDNPREE